MPTGIQRMPFGDVGSGNLSRFDFQIAHGATNNAYKLALLTGICRHTWRFNEGKAFIRSGSTGFSRWWLYALMLGTILHDVLASAHVIWQTIAHQSVGMYSSHPMMASGKVVVAPCF